MSNTEQNHSTETQEDQSSFVSFDDFTKLDMQFGTIKEAEAVPETDKLIKCTVDFGDETRIIVSGIKQHVGSPAAIVGKTVLYITNLEPRVIRGIESQGMLLAVGGKGDAPFSFIVPEHNGTPGGTSVN